MSITCMLVLLILIFLCINPWVRSFHLYHTKHVLNDGDHDCLYRYAKTANKLGRHLVPYCIRWIEQQETKDFPCFGTNYTFSALRHANINVTDLYNWYAAIDLIADYALYLEMNDDDGDDDNAKQIFCNCSDARRFGHRCQYIFAFNSSDFRDIIEETFALNYLGNPSKRKFDVRNLTEADITCYPMFNCTTYIGLCLDWRQICDSIRDCTNGRDEENCLQMELNECDSKTEYRCRNGMCIPRIFSFDLTMDCMDFYDEQRFHDTSRYCSNQSSIDCEDHSRGIARFSCGDGSCFEDYSFERGSSAYAECDSQRNSLQLKSIFQDKNNTNITYDCWRHMMCLLGLSCLYDQAGKPSRCYEGICYTAKYCKENRNFHLSCPEKFFFPPTHFVFPFVRLLYTNKPYAPNDKAYFSPPIAICYNRSVCNLAAYMNYSSVQKPDDFGGYECRELLFFGIWPIRENVGIGISQVSILAAAIHNVFSHCSIQSNFSKSLYICPWGRLIPPHRLYDRYIDCFPMMNDEGGVSSCARNLSDRFRCREDINPVCIPRRLLRDNQHDCRYGSEEYFPIGCTHEYDCQYLRYFDLQMKIPVFYKDLCDGYSVVRQSLENIESDETSSEQWSCYAPATRCNGVRNRPNGCDELNCPGTIPDFITGHVANCSSNEHYCLQYNSSKIGCLPVTRANDGIVDCLFPSDERLTMNVVQPDLTTLKSYVYCYNSSDRKIQIRQICNQVEDCDLAEDELLCPWHMQSSCPGFTCKNGTCLSVSMRCNRQIDCLEAEDEWACDFENDLFVTYLQTLAVTDFNFVSNEVQRTSPHVKLKRTSNAFKRVLTAFSCVSGNKRFQDASRRVYVSQSRLNACCTPTRVIFLPT